MTVTLSLVGFVTNSFGFISTSTRDMKTKLDRMIEYDALAFYTAYNIGNATYRSCDKHLWLYLYFYQHYTNQNWQNGRRAWAEFNLHMTKAALPTGYVKNIFGFVSTSTRVLKTKLGRIVYYHALSLKCL